MSEKKRAGKIRFGVVGLGWIAQTSVLPAFRNAKSACELTALVSGDAEKLKKLGDEYGVEKRYSYEEFDQCLEEVDAVYIALPNDQHLEFTVRAAEKGVHVLCEKPMALNMEQGRAMIEACRVNDVRLMIAYRLHFEKGNLSAIDTLRKGKIGEPRFLRAAFSMQAAPDNYRLEADHGGGPLLDLGIYCINASRYLFQEEPLEVMAFATGHGARFTEVEEMASVILKFPQERLASFTCSFGAADTSSYEVVGTQGVLRLDPAFEVNGTIDGVIKKGEKEKSLHYGERDQFAPELIHFSECIQEEKEPEPSGIEGLADMAVLDAIFRSIRSGKAEKVEPVPVLERPSLDQEIHRPAHGKARLVHVQPPTAA